MSFKFIAARHFVFIKKLKTFRCFVRKIYQHNYSNHEKSFYRRYIIFRIAFLHRCILLYKDGYDGINLVLSS
jgi:hypothetical protein